MATPNKGIDVNSYTGSRYGLPVEQPAARNPGPADPERLARIEQAKANNNFVNPDTGQKGNQFQIQRFQYNASHASAKTGNSMDDAGHIWNVASTPPQSPAEQASAASANFNAQYGAGTASAGTGPQGTIQYTGADGSTVNAGVGAHTAGLQTDAYGNQNSLNPAGAQETSYLPSTPRPPAAFSPPSSGFLSGLMAPAALSQPVIQAAQLYTPPVARAPLAPYQSQSHVPSMLRPSNGPLPSLNSYLPMLAPRNNGIGRSSYLSNLM